MGQYDGAMAALAAGPDGGAAALTPAQRQLQQELHAERAGLELVDACAAREAAAAKEQLQKATGSDEPLTPLTLT